MQPNPATVNEPAFPHESHLPWAQLEERGHPLPGWVTRHRQVKAINQHVTLRTYHRVEADAPLPDGFSWTNLDHCGGWWRHWSTSGGTPVDKTAVLSTRVLTGKKVAGSAIVPTNDDPRLDQVIEMVESTPNYTVNVTAAGNPNFRSAWIAPDRHLGELVDLAPIRDFYTRHGINPHALDGAEDIYLPTQGTSNAFDQHHPVVTGLILGYPPASTLSILLHD